MKKDVEYFEKPGPHNTAACVEIVRRLVGEGRRHVVVASTTGETAVKFAEALKGTGARLVSVGLPTGSRGKNIQALSDDMRRRLEALGVAIVIGTVPMHGLDDAFAGKYQSLTPGRIVAETLWRIGHGVKVACEVVWMACDAGKVPEGEEVVGVGGTSRGSDAVLVVKSASTAHFLDFKVLEIAAKPREG